MDIKQKEILVRMIVEEVINKIILDNFNRVEEKSFYFNQHNSSLAKRTLINADKVEAIMKKGYKSIVVPSNTIFTPLANDLIKDNGLSIQTEDQEEKEETKGNLHKQKSDKIVILTNYEDEAYRVQTERILNKMGVETECLSTKNSTASELYSAVNNLSENIQLGKYGYGIVISNDSYHLMKSMDNKKLKSNICWEIGSNNVCKSKSQLLFINASLIGFKTLEEKIKIWLKNI